MAKKAKVTPQIDDFFGNARQYKLLGLQSGESFFIFLKTLENYLHTDVRFLAEVPINESQFQGAFQSAFTEMPNMGDSTIIILENKSTLFNQSGYPTSKNEKNLSFHTLSLFDEYGYILNSQGICLHNWEHTDCDYLILISAIKEYDLTDLMEILHHIPKSKLKTTNDIFAVEITAKKKSKMRVFFEDIFCTAEIQINEWKSQNNLRLLLGTTHIPETNIPEDYLFYEEFTQTFTSKYLEFAYKDPSYDFSPYDNKDQWNY
ncbi:MAG: hypothetical protein MJZ46_06640 [Bacteroidales bacterium]|nr:hypothetical protein [Bacteroidales bacterium]